MPLGVEVLIDQETLRRMVLSSLDYYTHHISPHTIPPKMTKLSSKLNLTKLFYISPCFSSGHLLLGCPVTTHISSLNCFTCAKYGAWQTIVYIQRQIFCFCINTPSTASPRSVYGVKATGGSFSRCGSCQCPII